MSDIAITGIGLISPLGVGRGVFWENLSKAKTGIKMITSFDTSPFKSNAAAWVEDFDPRLFLPSRTYRRMSRVSRMAVAASQEALEDSGLVLDDVGGERIGVIMGTCYGGGSHVEDFYVSLLRDGPRGAQPLLFPETVPNAAASHIAMFHGITGPNSTFCQNEISVENAIHYARNLLLQKAVDAVLVGGADELSAIQYSCYHALGALNPVRAERDGPVRPEPGKGLILGEGAGVMVMERIDSAQKRGAEIYGKLKSAVITGGRATTGHYEVGGEQMARAMNLAFQEAGMGPGDIDQIHVSANYSGELDRMEYEQLKKTFPKPPEELAVTPLKYLIGDFGAAGIIRGAAILLSLFRQKPPPTVKASVLKRSPRHALEWDLNFGANARSALMTTSTFGGGSSSMVFTSIKESL
jgi:3-oxoacyl-[acyl-carrier-protein] synthase II